MKRDNDRVLIAGEASAFRDELAREFAKNGHDLALTAREEGEISRVVAELTDQYGVEVQIITQDLCHPEGPSQLLAYLLDKSLPIEILVNNFAVGHEIVLNDDALEAKVRMAQLHLEAIATLTRGVLIQMQLRGRGRILNASCAEDFSAAHAMEIYHASKNFMLSFSEALRTDIKNTGIGLTAAYSETSHVDFYNYGDLHELVSWPRERCKKGPRSAERCYKALMMLERIHLMEFGGGFREETIPVDDSSTAFPLTQAPLGTGRPVVSADRREDTECIFS